VSGGGVRRVWLAALATTLACGGAREPVQPNPDGQVEVRPSAPWSAAPLDAGEVPVTYVAQWRAADNRESCALIAPITVEPANATPRAASFSGGWAVAYDTPEQRSAFGVAGAGVSATGDVYDEWPHRIEWADGSSAGYGPEGGTGPNQLAYLRIAGQDCLYNVWSRLGVEHLETLLGRLRFVEAS